MIRKSFFVIGALLFLIFTSLQFNDAAQYGNSDAWTWIILYGAMGGINAALLKFNVHAQWLYAWAGFTWGALLFRLQDNQGNLHIEWLHPANYWDDSGTTMIQQSNESGGLLILAVWASVTVFMARLDKSNH